MKTSGKVSKVTFPSCASSASIEKEDGECEGCGNEGRLTGNGSSERATEGKASLRPEDKSIEFNL